MSDLEQYLAMDACDMAAGLSAGDFSANELLQCAIKQAEKVEPSLNTICTPLFEQALAQTTVRSTADAEQKFAGLPFLLKDLADLKSCPTSRGSRLFQNIPANKNSAIVQRYLDAGLIVLGKTNTPEFGLTLTTEPVANGVTHNPWHLDYSTGGSSGGAAAAVAAGIVPVAHASDGGGSIRIPAACCGLFGLKPSRGLTATENEMADCWSGMGVGHVLSRSVRDSAHFLDMIRLHRALLFPLPAEHQSFAKAYQHEPGPLKIALQNQHPFAEPIDGDCLEALDKASALCESLGHTIVEQAHPANYRLAAKAMNKIICVHTYQAVQTGLSITSTSPEQASIETSTRQMAEYGASIAAADYIQALDNMAGIARDMQQFHQQVDCVLSPVLSKHTAQLGWLDMNSSDLNEYASRFKAYSGFTALYNGTGQPSMSVPLHQSVTGLPVGVMFSAAWGQDLKLLQLAQQLEQAQPWPQLAPMAAAV